VKSTQREDGGDDAGTEAASLALVARIARSFGEALDATLERVAGCDCGEETSCYGCLRGYRSRLGQ